MSKIAVLLSGQARFWNGFQKEWFYNADYFIHSWTYKDDTILERNSCYGHTNLGTECYKSKWSANQELVDYFKPVKYEFELFDEEKEREFLNKSLNFIRIEGNGHCRNGVLPMFYSLWKSNELLKSHKRKYDIVIRARFDIRFKSNPIPGIINGIHIPDNGLCDWAGVCDQFAVASQQEMDYYASLYSYLEYWALSKNEIQLNPELLLLKHLRNKTIRRYHNDFWLERGTIGSNPII